MRGTVSEAQEIMWKEVALSRYQYLTFTMINNAMVFQMLVVTWRQMGFEPNTAMVSEIEGFLKDASSLNRTVVDNYMKPMDQISLSDVKSIGTKFERLMATYTVIGDAMTKELRRFSGAQYNEGLKMLTDVLKNGPSMYR